MEVIDWSCSNVSQLAYANTTTRWIIQRRAATFDLKGVEVLINYSFRGDLQEGNSS